MEANISVEIDWENGRMEQALENRRKDGQTKSSLLKLTGKTEEEKHQC